MSNNATPIKNLSLTGRILALFNAGDEGKVNSFLLKVIRDREKQIATREQNMKAIQFEHDNNITTLREKLEDAEEDYNDAFLNVDPAKIDNNTKQSEHIDTYLGKIEAKLSVVESYKSQIKSANTAFSDKKDESKLEISTLRSQIAVIKG